MGARAVQSAGVPQGAGKQAVIPAAAVAPVDAVVLADAEIPVEAFQPAAPRRLWIQADVPPAAGCLTQRQQATALALSARLDGPDAFHVHVRHGGRVGGWLDVSLVRAGSTPADVPQAFRE